MEQPDNLFDLHLDQPSLIYLNESARWARFLAVIGFIFCVLMLIMGVFFGPMIATQFAGLSGEGAYFGGTIVSVSYFLGGVILFFPCLYLFVFSTKMRRAFRNNDQKILSIALKNLKSFFKFWGIVTIVTLSLYALVLTAAIIGTRVGTRR